MARLALGQHRRDAVLQAFVEQVQRPLGTRVGDGGPGLLGRFLDQLTIVFKTLARGMEVHAQHRLQAPGAQHGDMQRGAQAVAVCLVDLLHRLARRQLLSQRRAKGGVVMLTDHGGQAVGPVVGHPETTAVALILTEAHPCSTQLLCQALDRIGLDALGLAQPWQGPAQFQQECLALLEAHPLGGVGDQAQYAADAAIGFAHSRIRHVEIDGFAKAPAFYIEGAILGPEGLTGFTHAAQQRLEVVPQFAPVLVRWPPERIRVLGADRRGVGIVVQGHIGLAPEQYELCLCR